MIGPLIIFFPAIWVYRTYKMRDTTEADLFEVRVKMNVTMRMNLCQKLLPLVGPGKFVCDKYMSCLRVEQYGRWANQMWALRRAIVIAKRVGLNEIRINPDHALFMKTTVYDGITIIPEIRSPGEHCYFGNFFGTIPGARFLNLTFDDEFKRIFADQLGSAVRNISDNILTMHIRSGDIFDYEWTAAIEYGQPPCAFYEDVMKKRNWSEVWLFTHKNNNPCIDRVKALGAIEPGISWKGVIGTMMGTKNLVIGKGTLGPAVAAITFDLHRFYTANIPVGQFKAREHHNCVLSDRYINGVSLKWRRTDKQLRWMQTERCEAWEIIPYDPGPRTTYVHENNI